MEVKFILQFLLIFQNMSHCCHQIQFISAFHTEAICLESFVVFTYIHKTFIFGWFGVICCFCQIFENMVGIFSCDCLFCDRVWSGEGTEGSEDISIIYVKIDLVKLCALRGR